MYVCFKKMQLNFDILLLRSSKTTTKRRRRQTIQRDDFKIHVRLKKKRGVLIHMKYDELNRKQKQLIASEYPYKANHQLWENDKASKRFLKTLGEVRDFKERAAQDDVCMFASKRCN